MTMKSKLSVFESTQGKASALMTCTRGERSDLSLSREHRMRGEEPGHLGIEIDESDAFDLRIFENFADGEAVAAAEDEHAARRGNRGEARMDESFVVAVLIARAELQMAVEEEAKIVLEAGEDEMLVARVAGEDDVVGVDVVFGGGGDAVGASAMPTPRPHRRRTHAIAQSTRVAGSWLAKQIRGPERDAGVDETEQHGGADQTEMRHEKNRKEQRRAESAEIVEGQDVRDDVAKFVAVAHDAHEQRNLEANENSHDDDQRVENQARIPA